MPIIGSRGSMSARGFGMFATTKVVVGTQGILTNGGNINTTRLWNWTTDGVTAATNMTGTANIPGGGCGIPQFAILPRGSSTTGNTDKYVHASASMSVSSSFGTAYSSGGAYGNQTKGLLITGNLGSAGNVATLTYTYAGDVAGGGGNLATPRNGDPTVLGDATRAIISGGTTSNATSAALDAYTYATNSCASTTSLPIAHSSSGAAGVGNATVGIFTRTTVVTATQKFVYASNTTAAAGSIASSAANGQGCGSATAGIMMSTSPTSTGCHKYTYASDSSANTAALGSPAPSRPNFVNNGLTGVNG